MPFTPYPKGTEIHLCHGVPLDPTYEHTIYQASYANQYNTFTPYIKTSFAPNSYQRINRGTLRIATNVDNIHDCNYLIFKNTTYPNAKYYYAFITELNYINDNTAEVVYEIDVMQTYYFDFKLNYVFVEREHTITDNADENYIDEGFEVSDYMQETKLDKYFDYLSSTLTNSLMYIYVWYVPSGTNAFQNLASHNSDGEVTGLVPATSDKPGHFINGYFMGADVIQEPVQGTSAYLRTLTGYNVGKIIYELVQASANIIAIQLVPGIMPTNWGQVALTESTSFTDNAGHTYTPHNKKMLKYPFKKVVVSNNNGGFKDYRWESFEQTTGQGNKVASFDISWTTCPKGAAHAYPKHYAGFNIENGLVLNVFPTYTWSEDSFQTWWAQNGASAIFSLVSNALVSGIGAAASIGGGDMSQVFARKQGLNIASESLNLMSTMIRADDAPDAGKGEIGGDITVVSENRIGFSFYQMCIRPEQAQMIDSFLDMYGYKIGKLKQPNIYHQPQARLRPVWNYLQTRNCTLAGTNNHSSSATLGLPADAETKICKIFDKGITFWMNIGSVGSYGSSNAPTS